jgi:putative addiction module component (TIGR02574 family)
MIAEQIPAVKNLSLEEKWLLANELWDEVEQYQQGLTTSPAVMQIVERRFADFERDPSTAMTLDEFKQRYGLP